MDRGLEISGRILGGCPCWCTVCLGDSWSTVGWVLDAAPDPGARLVEGTGWSMLVGSSGNLVGILCLGNEGCCVGIRLPGDCDQDDSE